MAGNAHANRHGHQAKVCDFCAAAVQKLNNIVGGLQKYSAGTPSEGEGMRNFVKNCKPLLRQSMGQ